MKNSDSFVFISEKKQSVNKTVRFPKELVDRINKEIDDGNFSQFIIQACEFALSKFEKRND